MSEFSDKASGDAPEIGDEELVDEPLTDEGEQAPEAPAPESEAKKDGVVSELRVLETILRKTGAVVRRPILMEGAIWFVVTLIAVVLSALVFAALVTSLAAAVTPWILVMGFGAALVTGIVALVHFQSRAHDLHQVARTLQRHQPEFRNDLVAALEFGQALNTPEVLAGHSYSQGLAEEHVRRTVRRVMDRVDDGHLAHLLPQRALGPAYLSMAGAFVLLLIPSILFPTWTAGALTGGLTDEVASKKTTTQQIVGSIDVIFRYPSYTNMDRQLQRHSTGHIETLVGTQLTLQTYTLLDDIVQVDLVMTSEDDDSNVIAMQSLPNGELRAEIQATRAGTYHFRATLKDGRQVTDGIERSIRLLPDDAPQVTLTQDVREMEVGPDDVVELDFSVFDDFGIASVDYVFHFGGDEDNPTRKSVPSPELTTFPRTFDGNVGLDLAPLGLQPKDTLVVFIEARDNNNVTGPGVGRSHPLVLFVSSPEDKHLKNIEDQQELVEALLSQLADYLESPVGAREAGEDKVYRQLVALDLNQTERGQRFTKTHAIHRRGENILTEMSALSKRMSDDPLMLSRDYTLFAALYEQLLELHRGGDEVFQRLGPRAQSNDLTIAHLQQVANYAARAEDVLEKGLLRLEDLLASQKMEAIKATAEDIRKLKDRLRELLEQYRETQDPELKDAIRREIQRLRARMAELMSRMQMQMKKLPQEHVNMEALQQEAMESDAQQLADGLQSIEELLENDDIDGALAALDAMDAALDSMTRDMDEQFASAEPHSISELDKKVSALMDGVNDLEALERSIERDTRKLQEELSQRRKEEVEKLLEPFTKEMMEQISRQQKSLDDMKARGIPSRDRMLVDEAQKKLDSLREMVEQQDVEHSLERARSSLDSLRALRHTMNLSQRYTPKESNEFAELGKAERDLQPMVPRGQQIVEAMEEMMNQAQPQLSPGEEQRAQELAERQREAGERAEQLGEQIDDAAQRFPVLEQELNPNLEQARQAMQNAEDSLRSNETQPALDHERSALDKLGQLKQSMRQSLQRERQEQQRPDGRGDRVEIPTEDSRTTHERFRKEVMEGMREGRLEDYESEIERYYRSLVE